MWNSHQWIDAIMARLFAPEDRRIGKLVASLNQQNSELKGKPLHGFMHMGKRYIAPEYMNMQKALARQPLPTLAFTLLNQANDFDSEVKKLALDRDQIKQVLFQLIHQVNDLQELRDALPECLVHLVPEVKDLKRKINDPTWLIRSNKFAMKAYEKTLPKIEMYSVMGMMY